MCRGFTPVFVTLAGLVLAASFPVGGGAEKPPANMSPVKSPVLEVSYIPTPQEVVDKMLELAAVKRTDLVYDLGCGDGRIVVTAARKYKARAVGVDIDPDRVREARANVRKNKVQDLVTIKEANIFGFDFSDARVVMLFLLPELNVKLMPQLAKLAPGSRIVSHDHDMKGAKPKKVIRLKVKGDRGEEREHVLYLWVVPWEKE
jgi:SAM-dependent methyltransferase